MWYPLTINFIQHILKGCGIRFKSQRGSSFFQKWDFGSKRHWSCPFRSCWTGHSPWLESVLHLSTGISFDYQSSQWPRHFSFDPGGSQLFSIGRKVWTGCKRNSQQDESRLLAFGVFVFLMRKSLCAIAAWKVVDLPFPQRPLIIHPSLTTKFSRVMKSTIKPLNPFLTFM